MVPPDLVKALTVRVRHEPPQRHAAPLILLYFCFLSKREANLRLISRVSLLLLLIITCGLLIVFRWYCISVLLGAFCRWGGREGGKLVGKGARLGDEALPF